jgi:hypothetical protein
VIAEELTPEEAMYKWEKKIYDGDDTDLKYNYGVLTKAAVWTFDGVKTPQYRARSGKLPGAADSSKKGDDLVL